jgi:RNA polymerase sigma-70 factor, ECF subfamily
MDTADDTLAQRAALGDDRAFSELWQRHREAVARIAFRILGSSAELDDVVQEICVQVWRSLPTFRREARLSTWIHRIAVNVVLMHRRAARSRPPPVAHAEASTEALTDAALWPDEAAERRRRMSAFQRLLCRLSDKKRTVFVLHELEGVPPTEIAAMVGAPLFTVRTRLFYARRELEAMLLDEPTLAALAPHPPGASRGAMPTAGAAPGEG